MKTLLLLPGLLCDETVWTSQIAALSGKAECIVPSWGELDSLQAMARHVLDTAPAGPLCVAGHSMGGRVAIEVLRMAPERVERIALMDTGYAPIPVGAAADTERTNRYALLEMAKTQGMRAMGAKWARGMVHPDRLDSPLFEDILKMIERKTPAIFGAQINALLNRPDATQVLKTVDIPTLLLVGLQDSWSPIAQHERIRDIVREGTSPPEYLELAAIDEAGHMSTMERPDAVSAAMLRWLDR